MSKKKPRRLPYVVFAQWVGDLTVSAYWGRYGTEERACEEARKLLTCRWRVQRARVEREPVAPGEARRVVARYVRDGVDRCGFIDIEGTKRVLADGSVAGE